MDLAVVPVCPDFGALTEVVLKANKAHQLALIQHAENLTKELRELETLIDNFDEDEIEEEHELGIHIPGAKRPSGPCSVSEFLNPKSPFFEDASRRMHHLKNTGYHPMKGKELQVLADAVKAENLRLEAYRVMKGDQASAPVDVENNVERVNWRVVAEKVSMATRVSRTASQCRIKWLGDRHPKINHGDWSAQERECLQRLVAEQRKINDGKVDWVHVAVTLGTNRTPLDCMRHGIPRKRHVWDEKYDEKLLSTVQRHGANNWNIVAKIVSEDATASQCQKRYARGLDPSLKKGSWSLSEFERLQAAVAAYGNSWIEVAACVPGRMNDQCRERWNEHLAASSAHTQSWIDDDDEKLIEAVERMGHKWKAISRELSNGKTGAQCRLRYDKLMKRRASQLATEPAQVTPAETEQSNERESVQKDSGPTVEAPAVTETAVTRERKSKKRRKGRDVDTAGPAAKKRKKITSSGENNVADTLREEDSSIAPQLERERTKPRPRPRPLPKKKKKVKDVTESS